MIKNNLKVTYIILKRKKLFSAITILGIAVPLMFLMIIISSISHIAKNDSPQSNFDRVQLFDEIQYSIKRKNSMSGNMTMNPTYNFVKKYVKTMTTPEKVGVVTGSELFNMYLNNQKTKLKAVYTDGEFWDIANFKFIEGKAFNESDVDNAQQVAVIDEFTKNLIFGDGIAIGKSVKYFRKYYRIIGVVKNVDVTRLRTHANVYLPITTSDKYSKEDIYGAGVCCLLLANSKEQFTQIESEFNHIIKNFQLSDYEGLTKIDGGLRIETFNSTLKSLFRDLFSINMKEDKIIYFAYAIIFFFFILLPSINLLYIHISRINERSSEIGVRKSFGGNKRMLSKQFVFENLTITIFSGILGLIFTLLFCFVLNTSNIIP
jgi:putative ABC transport system permease protein